MSAGERPISLLLSGGGFRATVFHLGTIRYLRESKRLDRVKEVFSVSGGSILAGHLAIRWGDYNGDEEQFDRAASELVAFARSGFRENIVRKRILYYLFGAVGITAAVTLAWCSLGLDSVWFWLASGVILAVAALLWRLTDPRFRPVCFLERGYRTLYGKATLAALAEKPIQFHFLATNLTTGNIACYCNRGLYPHLTDKPKPEDLIPSEAVRLSECVAASSAFPPMFSPVVIDPKRLKLDQNQMSVSEYLTDGGVFDNLGVRAQRFLGEEEFLPVVSDAERRFDWATQHTFRNLVRRTTRSTDILMNRVNRLEFALISEREKKSNEVDNQEAQQPQSPQTKFVRLQKDFEDAERGESDLSPDLRRRSRRIRTDLDAFTPAEIQVLFSSGYAAAKHAFEGVADLGQGITFAANGMPTGRTTGRWLPVTDDASLSDADLLSTFDDSESPQFKLWNWRSGACWLGIFLALALLTFNPLSIRLFRRWPVKPENVAGQSLKPLGEIPDSHALLTAFMPVDVETEPDEASDEGAQPAATVGEPFVLGTDVLGAYTLSRRPTPFRFTLAHPQKWNVHYHKAFLVYEDLNAFVSLEPLDDDGSSYAVAPLSSRARIVILLSISRDAVGAPPLNANEFLFKIR